MITVCIRNNTSTELTFKSTTIEYYRFIDPVVGIADRYYRTACFDGSGTNDELVYEIGNSGLDLKVFRPKRGNRIMSNFDVKIFKDDVEYGNYCRYNTRYYQVSFIIGTAHDYPEIRINISNRYIKGKPAIIIDKSVDEDVKNLVIDDFINDRIIHEA